MLKQNIFLNPHTSIDASTISVRQFSSHITTLENMLLCCLRYNASGDTLKLHFIFKLASSPFNDNGIRFRPEYLDYGFAKFWMTVLLLIILHKVKFEFTQCMSFIGIGKIIKKTFLILDVRLYFEKHKKIIRRTHGRKESISVRKRSYAKW